MKLRDLSDLLCYNTVARWTVTIIKLENDKLEGQRLFVS